MFEAGRSQPERGRAARASDNLDQPALDQSIENPFDIASSQCLHHHQARNIRGALCRDRRQHPRLVAGQDSALVVRPFDQPGRMIRVNKNNSSVRLEMKEQLSDSLAGEPRLACEGGGALRPIQQIEQTSAAGSGLSVSGLALRLVRQIEFELCVEPRRPAFLDAWIGDGFEVAGLAGCGGGP